MNNAEKLIDAFGKKEKEVITHTSLYLNEANKVMAEQIFDGKKSLFCIYKEETGELTKVEYIEDGIKYVPNIGEEVWKKAILLPTDAEEYGTDEELEEELKAFINQWLDIPEDIVRFCIWNIKRSWVYQLFHTLNYFRALGDTGQGKSRFLDVLGVLHYKPISTSGASTAAPVFRIIDKWRGTLIMDEADFQKSDEAQDIIKIINQGYEKGRHIMRCDKENKNVVNFFEPFGPKILATRKTFQDKAVESRCITHVMTGTQRKDIKWNLDKNFYKKAQSLRNKLLMWRFKNYFKIDPTLDVDLGLGDLEPRVQQIVSSFVSLFGKNKEQMDRFKTFIAKYQEDLIDERKNSFEGLVVESIMELINEGETDICAQDIIDKKQITNSKGKLVNPRSLNSTLKSLGFGKSVPKRIGEKIKRCIPLETEVISNLCKRYSVTIVTIDRDTSKLLNHSKNEKMGGIHNTRYNRNIVNNQEQDILKNVYLLAPSFPLEGVTNCYYNNKIEEEIIEENDVLLKKTATFDDYCTFIKEKDNKYPAMEFVEKWGESVLIELKSRGDVVEINGYLKVID